MLNNSPKISVYITNFNYGKFLKKSINSVLKQSFKDFELIIIDDGSTDNDVL
jgi:glycosyltransferase involved in cell wall biosynthesis